MEIPTTQTIIQLIFLTLTLTIFYILYTLPKKTFSKLQTTSRATKQSTRHFLTGSHLLSRAKTTPSHAAATSLAKQAVSEADNSLSLTPHDAAALILRGLALDFLGRRTAALRALDEALTAPAVKGLSERDKGDALVKRAEVKMGLNKRRRVDSALTDLVEGLRLSKGNCKGFCLLGQCYEIKGLKDKAFDAFSEALRIEPESSVARDGLARLKNLN